MDIRTAIVLYIYEELETQGINTNDDDVQVEIETVADIAEDTLNREIEILVLRTPDVDEDDERYANAVFSVSD